MAERKWFTKQPHAPHETVILIVISLLLGGALAGWFGAFALYGVLDVLLNYLKSDSENVGELIKQKSVERIHGQGHDDKDKKENAPDARANRWKGR